MRNRYKCNWLDTLLKELLRDKKLKLYNRVKCIIYYYPELLIDAKADEFMTAIKFANDTYICLCDGDKRYSIFDKIYKESHKGADFESVELFERRYITFEQIFKHFNI